MLGPKDYIIEFNKLRTGDNEFEFLLNTDFIRSVDENSPVEANVVAKLHLFKTETMYDLEFHLTGEAKLQCDVCLEDFMMPVDSEFGLILKISEVERYDDDEIVYITPQAIDYDLKQYLYESLVLSLPVKRVCEMSGTKQCNPETIEKLSHLSGGEEEEGGKDDTDPRWDKLKGMFN